jgi:hypothetical protein
MAAWNTRSEPSGPAVSICSARESEPEASEASVDPPGWKRTLVGGAAWPWRDRSTSSRSASSAHTLSALSAPDVSRLASPGRKTADTILAWCACRTHVTSLRSSRFHTQISPRLVHEASKDAPLCVANDAAVTLPAFLCANAITSASKRRLSSTTRPSDRPTAHTSTAGDWHKHSTPARDLNAYTSVPARMFHSCSPLAPPTSTLFRYVCGCTSALGLNADPSRHSLVTLSEAASHVSIVPSPSSVTTTWVPKHSTCKRGAVCDALDVCAAISLRSYRSSVRAVMANVVLDPAVARPTMGSGAGREMMATCKLWQS